MTKVVGIVVGLIMVINSCFAQIGNLPDGIGAPLKSKRGETIEGKIYLHEEWNKASIEWKDGTTSENAFVKYNTVSGNLEVQKGDGIWEYSPKTIKTFEYAVNMFPEVIAMKFEPSEKYFNGAKGFVKIIFNDKILVLERIDVEVIADAPSYGTSSAVTKAIQSSKNFILLPDAKEPIQFRRTNSNLSKAIDKAELKEYLKSKKLDISNDRDLAMAMGYLKTFYN